MLKYCVPYNKVTIPQLKVIKEKVSFVKISRKFFMLKFIKHTVCLFLTTVKENECYTFGRLWSKMAFFKRAWRRLKVLSCPWALEFKSALIRPLKWGTLRSWTPGGSKDTSRQSWKKKKQIRLSKDFLTYVDWFVLSSFNFDSLYL